MGLDLYHIIPSIKTEETEEFFRPDAFDNQPEFLQRHAEFITDVQEPKSDFEILVFPDNFTKSIVLESNTFYKDNQNLVGEINQLAFEIETIAVKMPLLNFEPLVLKIQDNLLSEKHKKDICYYTLSYQTGFYFYEVINWKTIGYQRKGMDSAFYEEFDPGNPHLDKTMVLKAFEYIRGIDDEHTFTLKKYFQENFIDNFIEGTSVFTFNW